MEWLNTIGSSLSDAASGLSADIFSYFTFVIRFLLPVLAFVVLFRLVKSLLREKTDSETWGYLSLPNGARIQLNHWENIIGRSKSSDVLMDYPTMSRTHAALIRDNQGRWQIFDLGSKGGIKVNGKHVEGSAGVKNGDLISLGGVELVLIAMTTTEERAQADSRVRPGKVIRPAATLFFLTEFQILLGLQLCIAQGKELSPAVPSALPR